MRITARNLRMDFPEWDGGRRTVLAVDQLDFEPGEQVAIKGGSGSGKTTLLHLIAGILLPSGGELKHGDLDITQQTEPERDAFRARNIGYVFQTFHLLQGLNAEENVALAQTFAGIRGVPARKRVDDLLNRMGVAHRRKALPSRLSVGEQQRVAIARALVNSPKVVLADEPTANLDASHRDVVLDLLQETCKAESATLILVSHDPVVVARFGRVVALQEAKR